MYYYRLFQLEIASVFTIQGLLKEDTMDSPDVYVCSGSLSRPPTGLTQTLYKPNSVANQHTYYLELAGIAKYLIKGNKEVIIDKEVSATEQEVMTFFIDTILTILLLKKEQFLFHATAIKGKNSAVMICAPSGGGKSTLLMNLLNKGYQFIEDDRCLLQWDTIEQQVCIQSHFPFIDLWEDVQDLCKHLANLDFLFPIRKGIKKYRYDANAIAVKKPVPLNKIFILDIESSNHQIEQEELTGKTKYLAVKQFIQSNHLIPYLSNPLTQFKFLTNILGGTSVFKVTCSRTTGLDGLSAYFQQRID